MNLEEIKYPIKNELLLFQTDLKAHLRNKNLLLTNILRYIFKKKGKHIRPILVLLSAKLCGDINDKTINAAILVEILHTASLLHDDVIDNSFKRRGVFSINALWRNKITILTGDFLLSQILLTTVKNGNFKLLESYSDAIKKMSEGEILQIDVSRKNLISEQAYLKIIYNKTASLFAACCQSGALSISENKLIVNKLKMLGICIGMIFQIKDDILDITSNKLNKTKNSDFIDNKITLPLIYALNNTKEKNKILRIINSKDKNKHIKTITNFILSNNGIEEANKKIKSYENKALKILDYFNNSDTKEAFIKLISYASLREY